MRAHCVLHHVAIEELQAPRGAWREIASENVAAIRADDEKIAVVQRARVRGEPTFQRRNSARCKHLRGLDRDVRPALHVGRLVLAGRHRDGDGDAAADDERHCDPEQDEDADEQTMHLNALRPSMLCARQCSAPVNALRSSMLCARQCSVLAHVRVYPEPRTFLISGFRPATRSSLRRRLLMWVSMLRSYGTSLRPSACSVSASREITCPTERINNSSTRNSAPVRAAGTSATRT